MAVQAQCPSSSSNAFYQDFRTRATQINLLDELQNMNHGVVPFIFTNNDATVFSNPQSELTCTGSKKRIGDESPAMNGFGCPNIVVADPSVVDQSRLVDSAATSTSGRSSLLPISHDLAVLLCHQNTEIDALLRLQNERLRFGLDQIQKRHFRSLTSSIERQVIRRLKEKDIELEIASRKNAELEDKVRQIAAENQIWFNVAKNNEAIVSSLRSSLEQVLLQNIAVNVVKSNEGYGDSEGPALPADDAQSCCFEGVEERANGAVKTETATAVNESRRNCKICGEKDVSVLLLPCRHLCLCRDCEARVDTCPICHVTKNASLQIFIS